MIDDELPRELAELFAAERGASVRDLVSSQALRAKLAATVGTAPLGHATAGATAGAFGKVLATIALVVAAGGGALAIHRAATAPIRAAVPQVGLATSVPPADVDDDWVLLPATTTGRAFPRVAAPASATATTPPPRPVSHPAPRNAPVPPAPTPESTAPVEPSQPEPRAAEPSQIALLHDAWSALSSGDNNGALALAQRDERLHALEPLAEERSVIIIEALAKLGRMDDARTEASVFFMTYPTSVHRGRVERLLR